MDVLEDLFANKKAAPKFTEQTISEMLPSKSQARGKMQSSEVPARITCF